MDDSPRGKTDAPSGPSMGIFLRHMDFISANGPRARPWQNTGGKKPEQNRSGPLNDYTERGRKPELNLSGPLNDFTVRGKRPEHLS